MPKNTIKGVVFDCFGVLLTDPIATTMSQLGLNDTARQQILDVINAANRGYLAIDVARQDMATIAGVSMGQWTRLVRANELHNTPLFLEIARIRAMGLKTAILSNVPAGGLLRRFAEAELTANFDVVIESGAVGLAKPDAEIYALVADHLGLSPSKLVFIDDNELFCVAARAAGMDAICYSSFEQVLAELRGYL